MKLGKNDYPMRQLFSPSFIRIGQKLWNFYQWPFFERVRDFFNQTLYYILRPVLSLAYTFQFSIWAQFLDAKNTLFI